MPAGSIRIAGHVGFSRPSRPDVTPLAALLIRRQLTPTEVELSDPCTEVADLVAVTVELGKRTLTIVSAYVAPGALGDTHVLEDIRERAERELIVARDLNAHSQSWGGQTGHPDRAPTAGNA